MADKAYHLAKWKQSGVSKRAYARENGINRNTFYGWFGRAKKEPVERSEMVEVVFPKASGGSLEETVRSISVTTKNGYILSVSPGYDPRVVTSLLDLLEVR